MKRLELTVDEYLKILNTCKSAVSKNDPREELRYIKLDVTKDKVTAVSLNGYVLARYTFNHKSKEEFTAFIRPVSTKPCDCILPVVIEVEDDSTVLTMEVPQGTLSYTFKHPSNYKVDADDIIGDDSNREYKIAFDANILQIALEGLKKHHRGYFVFNCPKSPNQPALLRVRTDKETVEQLVLPVRMYDGEV